MVRIGANMLSTEENTEGCMWPVFFSVIHW